MLHVDIPTLAEISRLAEARGEARISIYLPTTPLTQEAEADRIKDDLRDLYMMLETGQITEDEFDAQEQELLDRLDELEEDERGVAVELAEDEAADDDAADDEAADDDAEAADDEDDAAGDDAADDEPDGA